MKGLELRRTRLFALALGCALAGCAKDPTELYITVSLTEAPARPVTSLTVTLDAPGGAHATRSFASLGAVPADADVAPFTFPALLDYLIPSDATALAGDVMITVEARDPLTDDALLAHGTTTATIAHGKTTSTAVGLTLDAPSLTGPDGGASDGAADDGPPGDAGTDATPAAP